MKTCNRCKVSKSESEFRTRKEKRRNGCVYLNSVCKQCEREGANVYYFNKKNDPDFKEWNRKRTNEYRDKNREMVLSKLKIRNAKPEHKAYMKEYKKKNKERIKLLSRERNKKYARRVARGLNVAYAKRLRATAEYQIKSPKSKSKNSIYLDMTDSEILLHVAKVRLQKLIKQTHGK